MGDETVLSDAAKAEIAAAVGIVAQDKGMAHIKAIKDHLMPPTPETDPPKNGDPTPPPKKDDPPPEPDRSNGGLWWSGERFGDN